MITSKVMVWLAIHCLILLETTVPGALAELWSIHWEMLCDVIVC